jgi:hypothetical protein
MKRLEVISTAMLLFFLGNIASVYSQQDQQPPKQDKTKPPAQQSQHDKAPPPPKGQPQPPQHQQQAQHDKQQQQQQQVNRPSQQEQHQRAIEQHGAWEQGRARSWQSEHRDWQQRGGYNGYRIPDDRYRIYFGQNHGFRIYSLDVVIYSGSPRFQFGGYWFSLVDPWPEYWSNNWYEDDDVYIEYYNGGYYMQNRRHPGVRLAINVYLN